MKTINIAQKIEALFKNQPFDPDLNLYKNLLYPGILGYEMNPEEPGTTRLLDLQNFRLLSPHRSPDDTTGFHNLSSHDLQVYLDEIHTGDLEVFYFILKKWLMITRSLKQAQQINQYLYNWQLRTMNHEGRMNHFILQVLHTVPDQQGNPVYCIIRCARMVSRLGKGITFSVLDRSGKQLFKYNPAQDHEEIFHNFLDRLRLENLDHHHYFIKLMIRNIYQNLDNDCFGVDSLSEILHLSRCQLYRKTVALTGMTPSELIRAVRMNEAAKLLQQQNYNVTEVSFRVGYSSPAYFIKNFRSVYRQTPKKFQKESMQAMLC